MHEGMTRIFSSSFVAVSLPIPTKGTNIFLLRYICASFKKIKNKDDHYFEMNF